MGAGQRPPTSLVHPQSGADAINCPQDTGSCSGQETSQTGEQIRIDHEAGQNPYGRYEGDPVSHNSFQQYDLRYTHAKTIALSFVFRILRCRAGSLLWTAVLLLSPAKDICGFITTLFLDR